MKDTPEGTTHYACPNRIRDEGGQARCCECVPHEGCNLFEEKKEEKVDESWWEKYLCDSCECGGEVVPGSYIPAIIAEAQKRERERIKKILRKEVKKWYQPNAFSIVDNL